MSWLLIIFPFFKTSLLQLTEELLIIIIINIVDIVIMVIMVIMVIVVIMVIIVVIFLLTFYAILGSLFNVMMRNYLLSSA